MSVEGHMVSAGAYAQKMGTNGGVKHVQPPPLPHVTNNIVPLSNVLRLHTQEAYKQLSRQIESLAHTRTSESDASRKKKLLAVIVALRQDFVKLYALVKWAQRSKDVSRLIDLLNWLRTQDFYFDNLALGVNELNHFSGAKLPESDILTAMEVLVKGRPQLPSYNYIEKPLVSPQRILQVLRDLNLALTARMALIDDMPARFRKNYVVQDGRVVITLAGEFRVSITVANDLIIDHADDYYKSPFFFIDFAFLFGVGQDNALTTHRDSKVATVLPRAARESLEAVVNQVLLTQSLGGLYDVLHKYASSFKLYLISRQLRNLAINSKWRGNIQYKYSSFLVIVNYWSNHYLSRNWRSFIEIGVDKNYNLNFRWFKNGRYDHSHGIASIGGPGSSADSATAVESTEDSHELNIDFVLSLIINKHSEILIQKVYESYTAAVSSDSVSFINCHQLLIKLTPKKSTVFALNPLTGHFYFMNPSPIETAIQNKINAKPSVVKNKSFTSEADMITNVVTHLIQLRTESLSKVINMRLVTMGWVANAIIKLSEYETAKLFNFIDDEKKSTHNKTSFFRCRRWPTSWFLINMISGSTSKTYWWVARLRSVKGEWVIQWVQKLEIGDSDEMDHAFFKELERASSSSIIHHLIVEELQSKGIGFVKLGDEGVLAKFNFSHPHGNSSSRAVLALHNSGNLLPIAASSSTLFLSCSFSSDGKSNELRMVIFGSLRNRSESDAQCLQKLGVTVDSVKEQFHIESTVDLASKLNNDAPTSDSQSILGQILSGLAKMNSLIKILEQVKFTDLTVASNSCEELSFHVDPYYKPFILRVQSDEDQSFVLNAGTGESRNVEILVRLLNSELDQSGGALLGSFKYLKVFVCFFEAIDSVEQTMKPAAEFLLQNKLRKLHFEPKLVSLSLVQFVFAINSTVSGAAKKIQRDKIVFNVSLKSDKFAKNAKLLLKFSMKENFNSQNMKFKKLFETIFTSLNEVQKEAASRNVTFVKLQYDFVIDCSLLKPLMHGITKSFLEYLQAS